MCNFGIVCMKIMSVSTLVNLIMPMSMMVDAACDFHQRMGIGDIYYIYNNGYPGKYAGGTSCRYTAEGEVDTQIVLTCEVVEIPASRNCEQDKLSISLTGNQDFQDATNYCGTGTLSLVSQANKLAVGLFSAWYSSGGRFRCTVTATHSDHPTGSTTTPPPPICDCGWKQETRIVGGVETGINEYPSMAGLVNAQRRELYCGASIIAVKYVLSAAHCLTNQVPSNIGVLVGDHNLQTGADTASSKLYLVDHFIIHPYYNNQTRENDVGIVKTLNLIKFDVDVGPVCLPFRYSDLNFVDYTVTALGWGTTQFSGPKSDYLQKVNLTVVANQGCQQKLTDDRIFSSQLCTFAPGKDACQYDSGGPVLWYNSQIRRLELVGVISYGLACGLNFPGVNTRVTSYLPWIVSATNDTDYCIK